MFDFMDFSGEEPLPAMDLQGPYIPDAGECMRCGMCVSHCPTFRLFQIDEETPRRRIRSISKIIVEQQELSGDELSHLNNCVQCRACESICPSRMSYGQLFDQTLAALGEVPSVMGKLGFKLIEKKQLRRRLMPFISLYIKTGLQKTVRSLGWLKKIGLADAEALLQAAPTARVIAESYPARPIQHGRVALFTGCLAEHFDQETLHAAIDLLTACGYEVLVPEQQVCCGAIHQHNGQDALALINRNLAVFNALDVQAVLFTASGCGAMLSEYQGLDTEQTGLFHTRLQDIHDFLLQNWPDELSLQPLNAKIAVHEPCSQRNVLKNQQSLYGLLQKIPQIQLKPLADNHVCCGAGGSYMLTHPENARQLVELKRHSVEAAQVDVVVSSNFGCAVFMNRYAGSVQSTLCVLARQLPVCLSRAD